MLPPPSEKPEHLAYAGVEGAQIILEGGPGDIGFWVYRGTGKKIPPKKIHARK